MDYFVALQRNKPITILTSASWPNLLNNCANRISYYLKIHNRLKWTIGAYFKDSKKICHVYSLLRLHIKPFVLYNLKYETSILYALCNSIIFILEVFIEKLFHENTFSVLMDVFEEEQNAL